MYCKKCGNQIDEGAAFCKKCGTPVEKHLILTGRAQAYGREICRRIRDGSGQGLRRPACSWRFRLSCPT